MISVHILFRHFWRKTSDPFALAFQISFVFQFFAQEDLEKKNLAVKQ